MPGGPRHTQPLLLFLPLIWTSSVTSVPSSKSAEDGQSQVVSCVYRGVAERFSGRRGGRERLGVRAEGTTAGGVVGWRKLTAGVNINIDVEIFVQLSHSWAHVGFVGGVGVSEVEWVNTKAGVGAAKHGELLHSTPGLLLGWRLSWSIPHLVHRVDEVTSRTVGAEPDTVVGATQVRLVFWVSGDCAEFLHTVSKLAFLSIFARSILLKGPTHFCLVSGSVLDGGRDGGPGRSLALASV